MVEFFPFSWLARFFQRNEPDLSELAKQHGTDKWGPHSYTPHYGNHLLPLKNLSIKLLEIGVGDGASLRMWKDFFPKAKIFGIDILNLKHLEEERVRIFQGSQGNPRFLREVAKEVGEIDLIIDDGSHINRHVILTFETLFPSLKNGGIYVIEDLQTSYWPEFGGVTYPSVSKHTSIGRLKDLVDGLNHAEFRNPNHSATYFDLNICSLHFYHNLVFIYKGRNDETSNLSLPPLVQFKA